MADAQELTAARESTPESTPPPLASRERWVVHAACRDRPELFFGPHNERNAARTAREDEARSVCATCPVLVPCRTWAREHRELGIWGGETEEERARAGFPARFGRRDTFAGFIR